MGQDLEFLGCERDFDTGDVDTTGRQIHDDIAGLDHLVIGAADIAAAPRGDLDAGPQLAESGGFDHVVVGAGAQCAHHGAFVVAGGQHHHRDLADAAQPPQDGHPVVIG